MVEKLTPFISKTDMARRAPQNFNSVQNDHIGNIVETYTWLNPKFDKHSYFGPDSRLTFEERDPKVFGVP